MESILIKNDIPVIIMQMNSKSGENTKILSWTYHYFFLYPKQITENENRNGIF